MPDKAKIGRLRQKSKNCIYTKNLTPSLIFKYRISIERRRGAFLTSLDRPPLVGSGGRDLARVVKSCDFVIVEQTQIIKRDGFVG